MFTKLLNGWLPATQREVMWREMQKLFHLHFLAEVFLAVFIFIVKFTPGLCDSLLDQRCGPFDVHESEMLLFFLCVIAIKGRRQNTFAGYLSLFFLFSKLTNLGLLYKQSLPATVLYVVLILLRMVLLPAPTYHGPDAITNFRTTVSFTQQLARDTRVTWLMMFSAPWSPPCGQFAPDFAELSHQYALDNLRFGRVDITTCGDLAKKFKVNTSTLSKELPSLILFEGGVETMRRPSCDIKGRLMPYAFTKQVVEQDFDLLNLHQKASQQLKQHKTRRGGKRQHDGSGDATEGNKFD